MEAFLGGTFTSLHRGHLAILREASKYSRITIGLASDEFAKRMKIHPCDKYSCRLSTLRRALSRIKMSGRTKVVKIDDSAGPAATAKGPATLVVSAETEKSALQINRKRKRKGLAPLKISVVQMQHGEDGIRLSSTRILQGKISREGRRLSPVRFAVGSKNPVKNAGVKSAAKRAFPKISCRFVSYEIKGHAPEQPIGYGQTWRGAMERAKQAFSKAGSKCDYGVGLESGLIRLGRHTYDIQFCCLYDGFEFSAGGSMGFPIPQKILNEIGGGRRSLGDVVSEISGIKNIGTKGGALAYLSRGLLHRKEMVEQAFLCALVERRSPI